MTKAAASTAKRRNSTSSEAAAPSAADYFDHKTYPTMPIATNTQTP
eukprot:CAMPEP_0115353370 /NCGR_PEP_ID=MMETSP0270-20121206/98001_1 /TAXON_ID=71861 /ORGANISM="Scrippsiella trochoidea, Strain CCMP3099" /LENGTH=45 /DNA_ID= /DNA_START= /DNA_END= /DNA_ORIENTATION=